METQSKRSLALAGVVLMLVALLAFAFWGGLGAMFPVRADPDTRYVDGATGSDDSDCSDPTDPCATINYALTQAVNNDEILVAVGTYFETLDIHGDPLTLRGGYTKSGSTWSRLGGETIVDANGADSQVVSISPDNTVFLEDFTIQGANHASDYGGGFYVNGATVVISDTIIRDNVTASSGGGIYVENTVAAVDPHLSLINSSVLGNTADGAGGFQSQSGVPLEVSIQNTVFAENSGETIVSLYAPSFEVVGGQVYGNTVLGDKVVDVGGSGHISGTAIMSHTAIALWIWDSSILDADNLTVRNSSGGGIVNRSVLTLTHSLLEDNSGGGWPLVASVNESAPGTERMLMEGCTLRGNVDVPGVVGLSGIAQVRDTQIVDNDTVRRNGDVINIGPDATQVDLVNVLLADNNSAQPMVNGNAAASVNSLMNVTAANNTVNNPFTNYPLVAGDGTWTLTNTIVWGNDVPGNMLGLGTFAVDYSNIQGGWPGTDNLDIDPVFADAPNGDYHLWLDSPCMNVGTPAGAPAADLEGTPRDTIPDMGAYEWAGYRSYLPLNERFYLRPIHVLVTGAVLAEEMEQATQEFQQNTGIDIFFEGVDDFTGEIVRRAEEGELPDLALFPQPGLLGDLAAGGYTYDLNAWFSPDYFQQQYEQSWLDMATVNGQMAGVWYKANVKSLVWYPVPEFQAAGYQIPQNWTELLALSDQMAVDGRTPWCIGIESGPSSGWVGTDWVEDIMLRTTTAENYDLWVSGDLRFTSAKVRYAWQVMGSLWFNPNYVDGGRAAIASTSYTDAPQPMFDNPPGCWLHRQASFITDYFPEGTAYGVDYDYFPLPPINADQGDAVLIAGDLFGVFRDRPEIRTFVEYLTTGESARWWVEQGREVSPHKDADLGWYQPLNYGTALMVKNADVVRFDASDLMPAEVGAGSFWEGIVDYVNGAALDAVLGDIDASWP